MLLFFSGHNGAAAQFRHRCVQQQYVKACWIRGLSEVFRVSASPRAMHKTSSKHYLVKTLV